MPLKVSLPVLMVECMDYSAWGKITVDANISASSLFFDIWDETVSHSTKGKYRPGQWAGGRGAGI
jgi:hypothetical protein